MEARLRVELDLPNISRRIEKYRGREVIPPATYIWQISSLVRHGKEGERGFGGERQVRVVKNRHGEDEWTVTNNMTDPVRITMTEKAALVEKTVDLVVEVKRTVGEDVRVLYLTMFPRFVDQCRREHMADEDVWLLDGIRRDVNREVKDGLVDSGYDVEVVDW